MISVLVVIIAGWLLAAKAKSTWLGVAGCIVAGIVIGAVSVVVAVHSAVLPVDHARIPDAVFESSIRLSVISLVFYAIQRFVMRRANNPTAAQQPVPSDTRECPYCAEPVKVRAVVCKHCGRDIASAEAERKQRIEQAEPEIAERPRVANVESNDRRLLDLCAHLREKSLDYDQYQQLARGAGASLGLLTGLVSTRYTVTRGESKTTLKRFKDLRPWFLENIVPKVERSV